MAYSKKPLFNLSVILKETGLKADAIRAWERRYQLPQPSRSSGGQRLYSEYDLQILLWLLDRQKEGMRIGQAAAYWHELNDEGVDPFKSDQEVNSPITHPMTSSATDNLEDLQAQWLRYCFSYDEPNAEQILSQAFAQYPVHTVCSELLLPGLRKVGELWNKGEISVQQEHYTSEIVSRKLQSLIASAPNPVHQQSILLGNPPGENHVIALMMIALLLKNRGWPIIYLGANVPLRDLLRTVEDSTVDLVIMSASRLVTSASLLEAIQLLAEEGTPVAFSGWIFSQSVDIAQQLPGLYLGNDLSEAVNKVEQFMDGPISLPPIKSKTAAHDTLILKMQEMNPQLNSLVLKKMNDKKVEFQPGDIISANSDLLADIIAALKLGGMMYINPNLDWVSKLLINRNFPESAFQIYLSLFAESIGEILGNDAKAILHYFKNYSQ